MALRAFLYNLLLLVIMILGLPWILYQLYFVARRREGVAQRLGRAPVPGGPVIWFHAVSVGEVRAIEPMLSILARDPRTAQRMVLSTVTPTGQRTAERECGFASKIFYFPLDFPFAVGRALDRVRPHIFVTAETEIWPNFFGACFRRGIPVVVVNGRISDTSFPRYMGFRWFFRPFVKNVSAFLMQSEEDARRIIEIGARPETVCVTGNSKYDRVPDQVSLPDEVLRWKEGKFLIVAGSTHAGEEKTVLEAAAGLGSEEVLLALVPRRPERFDEVADLLRSRLEPWSRYSDILEGKTLNGRVLLVDTMGVLDGFYALADVAFVGGSLVPVGGHNLLEPAMHGVPVITGDHLHNFRDISDALARAGGCMVVTNGESLRSSFSQLYRDGDLRREMGDSGRKVSESSRGASGANATRILDLLDRQWP